VIPRATLIPLPGSSHLFYHGDWPAALEVVLGFLCEPASPGPRLTGRELEVARLTNQAIARRLSVAPRTAEAHVENIRRKLQVHSRAQIAAWVTNTAATATSSGVPSRLSGIAARSCCCRSSGIIWAIRSVSAVCGARQLARRQTGYGRDDDWGMNDQARAGPWAAIGYEPASS
jgi:DNA-binding CsgD family transcriptional regulator